jgi:hypothetical protein
MLMAITMPNFSLDSIRSFQSVVHGRNAKVKSIKAEYAELMEA